MAGPTKLTSGTAQGGGQTEIEIALSASGVDGAYDGNLIIITGGTGVGQFRKVNSYIGISRTVNVDAWTVVPDNTSTYEIWTPLPINEQISIAIMLVLNKLIVTPAPNGGTQLTSVERWSKESGNIPNHMKAVVYGGHEPLFDDNDTPIQATAWNWLYQIAVFFANAENSTIPDETIANVIRADIEYALMQEVANNTFLGGNVQNIWAKGAAIEVIEGTMLVVVINLGVEYRTSQFNPFALI